MEFMAEQFAKVATKDDLRELRTKLEGIDFRLQGANNRIDTIAGLFNQDLFKRISDLETQMKNLASSNS